MQEFPNDHKHMNIDGESGLKRDSTTLAVISVDHVALQRRMLQKKRSIETEERIRNLEEKVEYLTKRLDKIS